MSIALITTSIKKWNGVFCCVIHKTKYFVDILCTVLTLLNLYMKKCFSQTYTTAIFHFMRSFFIIKLRNIYKNTCNIYISMMKPEAATGGVP